MKATTAAPSPFAQPTIGALAAALGVGRNRPAEWLGSGRGAPAGKPYCELAWRLWAAAQGIRLAPPSRPDLVEALARAGVVAAAPVAPAAVPAMPTSPTLPPGITADGQVTAISLTLEQATALNKSFREYLDTVAKHREHQRAEGELLHVDDLDRLVGGVVALCVSALDQVPAIADEFTADPADRDRLRRLLVDRIHTARTAIADDARGALQRFLAPAP